MFVLKRWVKVTFWTIVVLFAVELAVTKLVGYAPPGTAPVLQTRKDGSKVVRDTDGKTYIFPSKSPEEIRAQEVQIPESTPAAREVQRVTIP